MLAVNGAYGEGGGQILRTSIALSLIMKKDVEIVNVRANRKPRGLKNQHLQSLLFIRDVLGINVEGAYVGSDHVLIYGSDFLPPKRLEVEWDLGTAASITLFLQTLLPVIMWYDIKTALAIKGGTNVKFSPSAEYYKYVLLPLLNVFGYNFYIDIKRKGYYPKGGGEVLLTYEGFNRKDVEEMWYGVKSRGFNHIMNITNSLVNMSKRDLCGASYEYVSKRLEVISHRCNVVSSPSPGIDGILYSSCMGIDYLGERGKRLENILEERISYIERCINKNTILDVFLSDQILLPLSVYANKTRNHVKGRVADVSAHFTTNLHIISKTFGFSYILLEDDVFSITPQFL